MRADNLIVRMPDGNELGGGSALNPRPDWDPQAPALYQTGGTA